MVNLSEHLQAIAARVIRVRAESLAACSQGCRQGCDECFIARMRDEPSLLKSPAVSIESESSNAQAS